MTPEAKRNQIANSLHLHLNRHGLPFEQSVISIVNSLPVGIDDVWKFVCAEFPVQVQSDAGHIDVVLAKSLGGARELRMVVECKRARQNHKFWVFTKAKRFPKQGMSNRILVDFLDFADGNNSSYRSTCRKLTTEPNRVFHHGVELKLSSRDADDSHAQPTDTKVFQEAVKQVTLAANGYINYWFTSAARPHRPRGGMCILPAIFTTAELWVCKSDISADDIAGGTMKLINTSDLEPVSHLLYECNISVNLKSDFGRPGSAPDEARAVWRDYTRTIAVVNSEHIKSFLTGFLLHNVDDFFTENAIVA